MNKEIAKLLDKGLLNEVTKDYLETLLYFPVIDFRVIIKGHFLLASKDIQIVSVNVGIEVFVVNFLIEVEVKDLVITEVITKVKLVN